MSSTPHSRESAPAEDDRQQPQEASLLSRGDEPNLQEDCHMVEVEQHEDLEEQPKKNDPKREVQACGHSSQGVTPNRATRNEALYPASASTPLPCSSPSSFFGTSPAHSTVTATTADSTPAASLIISSSPSRSSINAESLSLPALSSAARSSSSLIPMRHRTSSSPSDDGGLPQRHSPVESLVEATLIGVEEDDSTSHSPDAEWSTARSNIGDLETTSRSIHVGVGVGRDPEFDSGLPETAPLHLMGAVDNGSLVNGSHEVDSYHPARPRPEPPLMIAQAKPAHVEDSLRDLWRSRTGKMLICALITVVVVVAGGIAFAINHEDGSPNDAGPVTAPDSAITDRDDTLEDMATVPVIPTSNGTYSTTMLPESESVLTSPSPVPPTEAPTTNSQGYIVSLLPNYTLASLQDSSSPQSQALQWLMQSHDRDVLSEWTAARIRQRFALATFYYAANGNGWQKRRFWLSTDPSIHECDWWSHDHELPGYTGTSSTSCHESTLEYETLSLSLNSLNGRLVPEVALLTNLKEISLVGDSFFQSVIQPADATDRVLSGSLPTEWFTQLTKLTSLDLSKNALTGNIPTEIGRLTNLEKLHLNENKLQSQIPSQLFHLTKLENLWLQENQLSSTLPTEIGTLQDKSQVLSFLAHENILEGSLPSELGNLPQLTMLKLGFNRFTGQVPKELTNLRELRFLMIENNQLRGTVATLWGRMTALKSLQIGRNRFSGTIPTELGLMSGIRNLGMEGNRLTGTIPAELGNLTHAARIVLDNNQLTGSAPDEVCQGEKTALLFWMLVDCEAIECGCQCCLCHCRKTEAGPTTFELP